MLNLPTFLLLGITRLLQLQVLDLLLLLVDLRQGQRWAACKTVGDVVVQLRDGIVAVFVDEVGFGLGGVAPAEVHGDKELKLVGLNLLVNLDFLKSITEL